VRGTLKAHCGQTVGVLFGAPTTSVLYALFSCRATKPDENVNGPSDHAATLNLLAKHQAARP
jgi:hypothetical protein